jgi:dTDP-4-amino-4,6-dideoxygalactose transaminase
VQVHYVPVYRLGAHAAVLGSDAPADRFPGTEQAYAGLLSLPMFPDLTDDEQQLVVDTLLELV